MSSVVIEDRFGRRLRGRHIVPDGGVLRVPVEFADSSSRRMARAFRDAAPRVLHRPGFVEVSDDCYDAADQARARKIAMQAEAWKTPQYARQMSRKTKPGLAQHDVDEDDNAAEGMFSSDVPDDVAEMSMAAQQAYCRGYNQHMQENPDADDEECDAAGREAIASMGQDSKPSLADAAANLERIRDEIHARRKAILRTRGAPRDDCMLSPTKLSCD
jgi:hypothetical protein